MKKYNCLILVLLMIVSTTSFSQPDDHFRGPKRLNPEEKNKIEAKKAAFLTTRLELSVEEAQMFWPVYNEMYKKLDKFRDIRRQMESNQIDIDKTDDDQLLELMNKRIEGREAEVKLEKEYHIKFLEILSTKQVAKLYKSEMEFKRELLRQLKGSRNGGNMPPPKPH